MKKGSLIQNMKETKNNPLTICPNCFVQTNNFIKTRLLMVSLNDIPAAFRCRHRIGTPKCPCNHMRISACVLQETCKFIRVWMSHSVMNPSEPFSFLLTRLKKPRTMLATPFGGKPSSYSPPLDWFPFWWFSCGSKGSPGR